MTANSQADKPNPLTNIEILFGILLEALTVFFTRIFPLLFLGAALLVGLVYLVFKALGLA